MTQPLFPSTISTQSRSAKHKTCGQKNDGHTGSRCLDKAVLAQGGGGGYNNTAPAGHGHLVDERGLYGH